MIPLEQAQRIHVVGVGGAGMSAIATVLQAMGHTVSGSDQRDSAALARLHAAGVTTSVGHSSDEIAGANAVAVSTAIREDNVAVVAARAAGIPVYRRAEILAAICEQRSTIAVAGTHGKTTTTSMLSLVLIDAGWQPSFIIGGEVNEIGGGAAWSTGEWFVVEADESDGTFLELPRRAAIITNVAPDHLDHYGGYDQLRDAFARFAHETEGPVVVGDSPDLAELTDGAANVVSVGIDPSCRYVIGDLARERAAVRFTLRRGGHELAQYRVSTPGEHNARNAAVAAAMALELGVPVEATRTALERFTGVARRFQFRGSHRGVDYIDDYAHLPDEVQVAIAAARDGGWERVVAVFQPHLYSRTQQLAHDFATSFDGADHVIVTDIYGSREDPRPGVTGRLVVDAIRAARPDLGVTWLPGRADLAAHLAGVMRPGEVCLLLSARPRSHVAPRPRRPGGSSCRRHATGRGVPASVGGRPHLGARRSRRCSVTSAVDAAARLLGSLATRDAPLGARTTYRVGGNAALLVEAKDARELSRVRTAVMETNVDVLVLGLGSNMLVADEGFPGIVVTVGWGDIGSSEGTVTAGGSVPLPLLARRSASLGRGGLEWAVGIPGSVGGGVRMNAGGHGSDVASCLQTWSFVDLRGGHDGQRTVDDLRASYRHTAVGTAHVVTEATFRVEPVDPGVAEAKISEIVRWRRENQPGGQNAGSVFTNPDGDSAGRIIDTAGLKGLRIGTAEVSQKHANFIQADPGGRAGDVRALIAEVQRRVREETGVELRTEVRMIGFPGGAS